MRKHRKRKSDAKFPVMKYVIILAVVAIFVVALALYFLPFVSYYQIEKAIIVKDAGTLASYTDFNEIRQNLKRQKGQRVIKELGKDDPKNQSLVDLSILWAALGTDQDIDRALSTEGFYIALSGSGTDRTRVGAMTPSEIGTYQMVQRLFAGVSFKYHSHSRFTVSVKDAKGRYMEYFSFVFARDGLNWKLTNVILPMV
jgi:hypothetical protein